MSSSAGRPPSTRGGSPSTPSSGGETTGAAQEKAQEVAGQAQEKAQQAAGQAKSRVREQVDQRSTQAGEQVSTVAQDVKAVGDTLREKGQDRPAQWADQVAQRAEGFGDYLRNSDGDRILNDVEGFGRRQPLAVVGGGLLLGLAASRFLKASSARRYQTSRTGGSSYPRTGANYGYASTPPSRSLTPGDLGTEPRTTSPPVSPAYDVDAPRVASPARDLPATGGLGGLPDDPRRDPGFR